MRLRVVLLPLALLLAAPFLLTCGGGGGGGYGGSGGGNNNPPPANTIYVGGMGAYGTATNVFEPAALTVAPGTMVTFVWQGDGHGLESGAACGTDGKFSSGGLRSNGYQMTHVFPTAGTYPFYCTSHCGAAMKGTITVQ